MASQCHSRRSPPPGPTVSGSTTTTLLARHHQPGRFICGKFSPGGRIRAQPVVLPSPPVVISLIHSCPNLTLAVGCGYGQRAPCRAATRPASDEAVRGCSIVVAGSAAPVVRGPVFGSKGHVRNRWGGAARSVQDPGTLLHRRLVRGLPCFVCRLGVHLRDWDCAGAEMFYREVARTTTSEPSSASWPE
jgi:hypothetical protein